MSETPSEPAPEPTQKGDPKSYPDAHPGAQRDPVPLADLLGPVADEIEQATEPPAVTAARAALAKLLDYNRGSDSPQEEIDKARMVLRTALEDAANKKRID